MELKVIPAIHRATHRVALYVAGLRNADLSQGEAHILAHLAVSAPATIGDLHRALAHKRSTLTSILDRLTARDFVTRRTGVDDRRTFVIALTKKGLPIAIRVHRHLLDLERAVTGGLTPRELDTFLSVVARLEDEARRRGGMRPTRAGFPGERSRPRSRRGRHQH